MVSHHLTLCSHNLIFNMTINLKEIEELAVAQFVLSHEDSIHGLEHWLNVQVNGTFLAQQPGTDLLVVNLFSLLHDCKRIDDWEDPEHGERAAEFVLSLKDTALKSLESHQLEKLWWACNYHNKGVTHLDPTIGACFDADRLELSRCGILPRMELMSTPLGKRMAEKMYHSIYCRK